MNAAVAPKAIEVVAAPSAAEAQSAYASQLAAVPEFASYGKVFKSSSKPVELTESEMEYVVTGVKHIFAEHVVLQVRVAAAPRAMNDISPVSAVQHRQHDP